MENVKKSKQLIAAAIIAAHSGKIIGPYFLGTSLEAIESRYTQKLINSNLELQEIGIERVRDKRGFKEAKTKIEEGEASACMIAE